MFAWIYYHMAFITDRHWTCPESDVSQVPHSTLEQEDFNAEHPDCHYLFSVHSSTIIQGLRYIYSIWNTLAIGAERGGGPSRWVPQRRTEGWVLWTVAGWHRWERWHWGVTWRPEIECRQIGDAGLKEGGGGGVNEYHGDGLKDRYCGL